MGVVPVAVRGTGEGVVATAGVGAPALGVMGAGPDAALPDHVVHVQGDVVRTQPGGQGPAALDVGRAGVGADAAHRVVAGTALGVVAVGVAAAGAPARDGKVPEARLDLGHDPGEGRR